MPLPYLCHFNGAVTNDAPGGPFHDMSTNRTGKGTTVKGKIRNGGDCTHIDRDGGTNL